MTSAVFPSRLIQGYRAFRKERLPQEERRYRVLAEAGQRPQIMLVACCDSRAAPETIFDAAPGEMFVVRNVANLVPPHDPDGEFHGTSAALEYGVMALRVRHIVVMGHGRCGGVSAYLSTKAGQAPLPGGDYIGRWISLLKPAEALVCDDPAAEADRQRALEFASIRQAISNLKSFPKIAALEEIGEVELHGAWFDISAGDLWVLDQATGRFEVAAP